MRRHRQRSRSQRSGRTRLRTIVICFGIPEPSLENQSKRCSHYARAFHPDTAAARLRDSDIKFNLRSLMSTLRDTSTKLGAGRLSDPKQPPANWRWFQPRSSVREHPQTIRSIHSFLEPSSAQLWQAAGSTLRAFRPYQQFDQDLAAWSKRKFPAQDPNHDLTPDLTGTKHATLRISASRRFTKRAPIAVSLTVTASADGAQPARLSDGRQSGRVHSLPWRINDDPLSRCLAVARRDGDRRQHWKTCKACSSRATGPALRTRAVAVIAMSIRTTTVTPGQPSAKFASRSIPTTTSAAPPRKDGQRQPQEIVRHRTHQS